ncbi:MAG: hypothetical protein LBE56_12645 [Tannerella sp.]|jgi:hypothetical protein|nr:hypothetical protein [Tannerella sp.]
MGYYIGGAAYIPAVQTQTLTQIEVIPPTGYGFIYTLTMQNVMAEIEYNGVVKAVSFSYSTNGQSLIFTFDPIVIDSSLNKSVMIRLSKNGTGHFGFYKI